MARIKKPFTFSSAKPLAARSFNRDYQKIYDELDGNIDDTNIKTGANIDAVKLLDSSIPGEKLVANVLGDGALDYTSALVVRCGPTITQHGLKMASGAKAWAISAAEITRVLFVVFAVDSDNGNPNFRLAPRVTVDLQINSGDTTFLAFPRLVSVLATGFLVAINGPSPASDTAGVLNWHAMGDV